MLYVLLGCLLIFVSTFIHSAAMVGAFRLLHYCHEHPLIRPSRYTRPLPIAGLVLVMFLATVIESQMWAGTYIWLGAFDNVGDAAYYSLVTYTSLGYGDVVLHGAWRSLGAIEAANGVIMLGWTTALIFAAVQHVYIAGGEVDKA